MSLRNIIKYSAPKNKEAAQDRAVAFLFWKHANKDGSRDKRRQENQLMKSLDMLAAERDRRGL